MLLIAYASRYGQTARIARRIGDVARAEGISADAVPVTDVRADFDLDSYGAVVVAAPVYFDHHRREAEAFIERNLARISRMRSGLVSVSNAAIGSAETAEAYVHDLVGRTGWLPDTFVCVAGGEPFTKYGFFRRWFMRRVARRFGRDVDTRVDYDYTDWQAVDDFARAFMTGLLRQPSGPVTFVSA